MAQTKAQVEYEKATAEIKEAIDDLNRLLEQHEREARRNPKNWGFTGDVRHVKNLIDEARNFISFVS